MRGPIIKTYDDALQYIGGAKSQVFVKDGEVMYPTNDRSLYTWGKHLRIRVLTSDENKDIEIYSQGWNNISIMKYHKDDSITINKEIPVWASMLKVINHYSGGRVNMTTRYRNIVYSTKSSGFTPSKVSSCRKCRGTGNISTKCWGPGYEYRLVHPLVDSVNHCIAKDCEVYSAKVKEYDDLMEQYRNKSWEIWRSNDMSDAVKSEETLLLQSMSDKAMAEFEKFVREWEHPIHVLCKHGFSANKFYHSTWEDRNKLLVHDSGEYTSCNNCGGSGVRDTGGKLLMTIWDKTDHLTVDIDGNVL